MLLRAEGSFKGKANLKINLLSGLFQGDDYHSPVLASFFLRSSLRSGGLGPTREKKGPALIACACASTANVLEYVHFRLDFTLPGFAHLATTSKSLVFILLV